MARKKTKKIWLNPTILDWEAMTSMSSPNYDREWKRAYEIWNHAESRLNAATTNEDGADVISVLRRVLNHRISRLRRFYLDKLSFPGKPAGAIEQLELLGAAKKTMAHNLLEIRNSIEYQDRQPPNKTRCGELLEFTWYFLRSTDPLISSVAEDIEAYKHDKRGNRTVYGFQLEYGQRTKWKMKINGNFEAIDYSISKQPDWIQIEAEKIEPMNPQVDKNFKETDLWIIGYVSLEPAQYIKVCRFYFLNSVT